MMEEHLVDLANKKEGKKNVVNNDETGRFEVLRGEAIIATLKYPATAGDHLEVRVVYDDDRPDVRTLRNCGDPRHHNSKCHNACADLTNKEDADGNPFFRLNAKENFCFFQIRFYCRGTDDPIYKAIKPTLRNTDVKLWNIKITGSVNGRTVRQYIPVQSMTHFTQGKKAAAGTKRASEEEGTSSAGTVAAATVAKKKRRNKVMTMPELTDSEVEAKHLTLSMEKAERGVFENAQVMPIEEKRREIVELKEEKARLLLNGQI